MAYQKFYEKHDEATERWVSFDKEYTRKGLEAAKQHIIDVEAHIAENIKNERESSLTNRANL